MMSEEFPKEWRVSKLSDLGFSYSGLKSKSKKDFDEDGNALFVTYRNINKNYFVDKQDLAPVHVRSNENQDSVEKGDVLFTVSSETPEEVAFSSVMKDEIENLYLNSFSFGYRFNDSNKTFPDFYAYYFRNGYFRKTVFPLAQGSTRYNISRNELLKLEVPIPTIKEQQKIAAILSAVDKAIEKTEQIIEQTRIVKKGLMQQLLSKGIGHKNYKESVVGRIPESWKVLELSEVVEILDGQRKPIKKADRELIDGDIPYYGASGIIDWVNDFIFNEPLILLAEDGENLKSRNLPIAFKIEGKSWVNNHAHVLRPTKININFLEYYLESLDYEKYISGSAQPKLNQQAIRKIKVVCPDGAEQEKISNILTNIDDKIKKEKKAVEQLTKTKQGLMQQLLIGKVRVTIDENEEVPT